MFEGFTEERVQVRGTSIFLRRAGVGRPHLFLHGLPHTHLLWRAVAGELARDFAVVCAD